MAHRHSGSTTPPPIGSTVYIGDEPITVTGFTEDGRPYFGCAPQSIPSDEDGFEVGTSPEHKATALKQEAATLEAHAARLADGPERAWARDLARQYRRRSCALTVQAAPTSATRRTGVRSRGAGRPAHRTARPTRAGPDDDPGEPEPSSRRFCAGCGEDISHRRADARVCGKKCQKRIDRGTGLEQLLADRRAKWQEAAHEGGCHDLTYAVDRDLAELYSAPQPETARAAVARRNELDALAAVRWLMESNGVAVTMRHRGSPWSQATHALRTRPAVIACS